ncbi:hypothetical protein JZO70_08725 [Enterococcus sp. 669A]|uniref:Uncharacterized protein n=1 Tax=Candidatus Enterococcus moelleringii TaxID=2815325 RepID=A0ABS3LBZ0_9ENTE|nr:hypothetical protein [Enterococcus sp. 669A]MBO1306241.1 hypothetical protein [Enterococcus sp. 669A]
MVTIYDIFPINSLFIYLIVQIIATAFYWKAPKKSWLAISIYVIIIFVPFYTFFGSVIDQNLRTLGFSPKLNSRASAGYLTTLVMTLSVMLQNVLYYYGPERNISGAKIVALSILNILVLVTIICYSIFNAVY